MQSNCTEEFMGPKRDALWIITPVIVIYIVIFLTGTIGNISTCIVISRNKSMHTATNYYLFSLAISDLLLLISGLPQEIYSIYSRYPYIFGSSFCFLRGLFAETSTNATVLTITAFTVERYLAICYPFVSHTMSKLSRAIKLILGIWLIAVGLAVPQAMQFKIAGPPECESCVFYEPIIKHSFEVSTLLFFLMPMTLITVLYILIGVRLKASSRRAMSTRGQGKSSKKVVKMLVAVVVAFFICWAPFHAQRLYWKYSSAITKNLDPKSRDLYQKIYDIVTYISGILYYLSATINPILYNIMSVKFRDAFKETFARFCGIGHHKKKRPQRSYSVLSRSAQRGPESTDSGHTLQTHATLTNKSSIESNNSQPNFKRNKTFSTLRGLEIEEECLDKIPAIDGTVTIMKQESPLSAPATQFIPISINQEHYHSPAKIKSFWQYFECLAKRTIDDGNKRLSAYYSTPIKDPTILLTVNCVANSQSKDLLHRCTSSCEISNSSLMDVESGAIEDELTAYMKEVKRREMFR